MWACPKSISSHTHGFVIKGIYFFSPWRYSPNLGLGLPPWNSPFHFGFLDLRQSVGLLGRVISSSQGLYLYTNTNAHTQTLNIHAQDGIWTDDPGFRASEDSACLRQLGCRDRQGDILLHKNSLNRNIQSLHKYTVFILQLKTIEK
jgi:hypothetical protein